MVALDDRRIAGAGLDDIGVDGALRQEIHLADLLRFLLKDADEFFADDLALSLRLGHAGQLCQKPLLGIDPDEPHPTAGKGRLHLVALVFTHQAVVHKDAGQLIPYGTVQQGGSHAAVHAAGKRQQHLAVTDLLPQCLHRGAGVVLHAPVALGMANLIQEVFEDIVAELGMLHLRVELHPVQPLFLALDARIGGGCRMADGGKALRQAAHVIHMAHPADGLLRHPLKEQAFGIVVHRRLAEFPRRGALHLAAQYMAHHLQAVAQPQHRQPLPEHRRVHHGGALCVNAVRPAGKNNADGRKLLDLIQRLPVGVYLAVDPQITHPAGDQLIILPAEIQYQYRFVFHVPPRLFFKLFGSIFRFMPGAT